MNSQPSTSIQHKTQSMEGKDLRGQPLLGKWQDVNFRHVTTGTSHSVTLLRYSFALLIAFLSGAIAAYAGATFSLFFDTLNPVELILAIIVGLLIFRFSSTTLRTGFSAALAILSFLTISLIIIAVALTEAKIAGLVAINTLSIGGFLAGSFGLAIAITLTRSQFWSLGAATVGLVIGSSLGLTIDSGMSDVFWLLVLSVASLGLGCHAGYYALHHEDDRYTLIQQLAIEMSTWGSTSFRNSDLSNADFSQATLRHTDFRNAILTRTRWANAKFHQNNLSGTCLANPKIRRLLTSLDGQGQNFEGLDLRGVNLDEANLRGADLRRANLSNASLRDADLTRAILVQTQLYKADLTGAILSGACIENWGISPQTQLNNIHCKEIFLRLPTEDNPDPYRKPDNRDETFQDNDFINFIAPLLNTLKASQQQSFSATAPTKTLDLHHREGIEPTAAAIALYDLTQNHPEARIQILTIAGVEQKIRIQASITSTADPSHLSDTYFQRYNQLQKLSQQPGQNLESLFNTLAAQHQEIRTWEARIAAATDSESSLSTFNSNITRPSRRSANQRTHDRLVKAIDQQHQRLDNWEIELQAVNDQFAGTTSESDRVRLRTQIEQLENKLETGEQDLAMLEEQYRAQLHAKDDEIQYHRQENANMMEVVKSLAARPINNIIEVKAIAESKAMQGNDQSQQFNVGGDFNINAQNSVVSLREISGQVSNQINQLPTGGTVVS